MFHYGRVRVAGPLAWYETGRPNACRRTLGLYKIVLLSEPPDRRHRNALLQRRRGHSRRGLGSTIRTTRTSDVPRAMGHFYLGTDDQLADPLMMDAFHDKWTEAHRLRGVAYALGQFVAVGPANFTQGLSERRAAIHRASSGATCSTIRARIPPWRAARAAPAQRSRHLGMVGQLGALHSRLSDLRGWLCAADRRDRSSPRSWRWPTSATSRSAPTCRRPTIRAALPDRDDGPPERSAQGCPARLLTACDGQLYQRADGTIGIARRAMEDATASVSAGGRRAARRRIHRGRRPAAAIQRAGFPVHLARARVTSRSRAIPGRTPTAIAETGVVITQTVDFSQVPSHTQARRLCKIKIYARQSAVDRARRERLSRASI